MEALFPFRNSGVIPPMTPFIVASVWGMGSYALSDDLSSLWKKSFNVKHLGTIGLIILGLCIGGGVIWIVSTNLNEIIFLLDSHPWIPTLIIGILTFVGGVIFGRKRGQRPS
jgi:predicted tellurium resistance membrane protein TerC